MKVVGIKNITRKDLPIYYRRLFSAVAELEFMNERMEKRVEFAIETKPTGAKETAINLLDPLDYPLVPVIKSLKDYVSELDKKGALP